MNKKPKIMLIKFRIKNYSCGNCFFLSVLSRKNDYNKVYELCNVSTSKHYCFALENY